MIHFSQLIIDLLMRDPTLHIGTHHVTQIGSSSMWRDDRDTSCTPSGKDQRGVVGVYLVKVTGACAERPRNLRFFYWLQVARVFG
jgi:hypothetical protein